MHVSRSTSILRLVVGLVLVAGLLFAQQSFNLSAPPPPPVSRGSGSAFGTPGNVTLYYWVAARYPAGLAMPYGPLTIPRTVGVGSLSGSNFVRISWTPVASATGYYVIRQTQPAFPQTGMCTSCVVVANTAANTFDDVGGGTTNWPPAGVTNPVQATTASISLDNTSQASPFIAVTMNNAITRIVTNTVAGTFGLDLTNGAPYTSGDVRGQLGSTLTNETAYKWTSNSEWQVSGPALANLNWNARTGAVQGVGSRVAANFATVTGLSGADFRAASSGGTVGTLAGVLASSTTGAGTVTLDTVSGATNTANHNVGIATSLSGAAAAANVGAGATVAAVNGVGSGVRGTWNDLQGTTAATNFTAGVLGEISDTNVVGPTGAVVALLDGGAVRTGPNSPNAAFKVVDRNTTGGVGFNYGLDMYYLNGGETNTFLVADVRGQNADRILNPAAGTWGITRGSGARTVFQLEATAFADLGAVVVAGLLYCNDCTVTGAGDNTCAGGGGGALAVGVGAAWRCFNLQNVP